MTALANRYDIVFLFDVTNGNPNGDPDAGNMPRMDPETNKGLVSDVSLKRKIRNYTELTKGDQPGYRIYVQEGSILNEKHREAYKAVRGDTEKVKKDSKLNPQTDDESRALTKFMCDNFFDVRAFGAVMGLGINAGQVRGPVQVTFASSIETILPLEISITRMAVANEKEKAERQQGDDGDRNLRSKLYRDRARALVIARRECQLASTHPFGPDLEVRCRERFSMPQTKLDGCARQRRRQNHSIGRDNGCRLDHRDTGLCHGKSQRRNRLH
jgi:Cas7 group CRISPR-associated protein Csh2